MNSEMLRIMHKNRNLYKNFFSVVLLDSSHELMQKFGIFLRRKQKPNLSRLMQVKKMMLIKATCIIKLVIQTFPVALFCLSPM